MRYLFTTLVLTAALIPSVTFAATFSNFKELVAFIMDINQMLVAVIFALTFIVIAYGVVNAWIFSGGDPKVIENGKQTLKVGIIALVVMSGIWGILAILKAGLF